MFISLMIKQDDWAWKFLFEFLIFVDLMELDFDALDCMLSRKDNNFVFGRDQIYNIAIFCGHNFIFKAIRGYLKLDRMSTLTFNLLWI